MNQLNEIVARLSSPFLNRRWSDGEVQVAAVLDDFSSHCFSRAVNIWQVDPHQFKLDIPLIKPDFLLVESAWQGNEGKWRYMVTSARGPKPPLVELVKLCREAGIPTVFWNKEDPPHFKEFLPTARLFDYVLTTDAEMIPQYKEKTDAVGVELLRFAADATLHTPRRTDGYRHGEIAFAGQYFAHKFPERRQQMEILFRAAEKYDFSIYSRVLGGDPNYQFPPEFERFIVGSLPYSEMVKAYRRHKIFLNVNSVTNSSTMCARRVYELSASKTAVVGLSSDAIRSVYPEDEVLLGNSAADIQSVFQSLLAGREGDIKYRSVTQRAWRRTLSHHTYGHRIDQICELIGIRVKKTCFRIKLIVGAEDSERVRLEHDFERQRFTFANPVELTLTDESELESSASSRMQFNDSSQNAEQYEFKDFVGFIDSRFSYGRFYLNDLILALAQQPEVFAAKVLSGSAEEVQRVEEAPRNGLPDYGWLAESNQEWTVADLCRLAGNKRGWSDLAVYLSDPFGITGTTANVYDELFDS